MTVGVDPASYRDIAGQVHLVQGKVYRTVTSYGRTDYEAVRDADVLTPLVDRGWVISGREVENPQTGIDIEGGLVLEHPGIDPITYPWEWPFSALKAAALLHLDIHLEVFKESFSLVDASAFNIQLSGTKPIFIDYLSFRPYKPGEPWRAHRQFCEQFLNPLVLQAKLGIPFQPWFRGRLEGIPTEHLASLLRTKHYLSPTLFGNVFLPAMIQKKLEVQRPHPRRTERYANLKPHRFRAILLQLRDFIESLEPAGIAHTKWKTYAANTTYMADESRAKADFVRRFVNTVRPNLLIDLGCNTGEYADIALSCGASAVIGLDSDLGALEVAFARAASSGKPFLPLYQDLADPSPALGWARSERPALTRRLANADAVLALAVLHHLAIGRNVPLHSAVAEIINMARVGIIEFVPKNDPTVGIMLSNREDVFPHYDRESFMNAVGQRATIVDSATISASGRELVWFSRESN